MNWEPRSGAKDFSPRCFLRHLGCDYAAPHYTPLNSPTPAKISDPRGAGFPACNADILVGASGPSHSRRFSLGLTFVPDKYLTSPRDHSMLYFVIE